MTLTDASRPALRGEPGGRLFNDGSTIRGSTGISWSAGDEGGGLSDVVLLADGQPVVHSKADPADNDCVRLSQAVVPCPLEANGSLSYNTAALPDGTHTFQLLVTDIAGNVTTSRSVEVKTANHPVPNGIAPSHGADLRARFAKGRRSVVVGYGKRKRIYGRLTRPNGQPIAGASIRIYGRQQRTGAKTRLMKTVRTGSSGRFAWTPPAGPSRTLTAAYRAYSTDLRDAARTSLSLGVRAGVTLKLTPRRLHNGSRMHIRGTLRGGPEPAGDDRLDAGPQPAPGLVPRSPGGPTRPLQGQLSVPQHARALHVPFSRRRPAPDGLSLPVRHVEDDARDRASLVSVAGVDV